MDYRLGGTPAAEASTDFKRQNCLASCRVLDTRELTVNVVGSSCAPSVNTQAYVLNATVVPSGSLGFLTLRPNLQAQPSVSTLTLQGLQT